jgi:twitching motility protein PilT
MARVDSILNLVDRQGANELRLGTEKEPQMFADGAQKRLVIPKTSTETLRELLGELLPQEREQELLRVGKVEFVYEAAALGPFRVTLLRRGSGSGVLELDVTFLRGRGPAGKHPPPPSRPNVPPPIAAPSPTAPVAVTAPAVPTGQEFVGEVSGELAALVRIAAGLRASDLHLLSGEMPVVRIDGKLRAMTGEGIADVDALLGDLGVVARERVAAGTSADLGFGVAGVGRCRANVYQTSLGLAAAVRLLNAHPPTLAELRLPVPLDELIELPHGLVLVCGPTGSGKSTTLAALAQEALLRRSIMLITLEDPIEYVLTSKGPKGVVRQRQVGQHVKSFATGLRDALREDPDILIIGEMRDEETISLALTAAETGHLVLASLHSRSAASAVERIIDTYPPARQSQVRVQLADALRAVVAQRLLPSAKGEGRVAALEVLRVNTAIAHAIRESKIGTIQGAIQSGRRDGMLPLERCLADLVTKRLVAYEEARAVANDLAALSSYLSG